MNSVSYALDLKDYDALTRAVEKKRNGRFDGFNHWVNRRGSAIIACLLASIPLVLRWVMPSLASDRDLWFLCLGGGAFVFSIGFLNFLAKSVGRQRFRKSPYFGNEAQVVLEESGVRTRGVNGEGLLFWTHIKHVETTDSHIFLFLDEKQAIMAPKRAFASPAEAEKFGALAQKLWTQAHQSSALAPIAAPQ